jgi:hypothetical protein
MLPSNSTTWIFGTPPTRRRSIVRIGAEPSPGIFSCMMCVKLVVALSEPGM